MSELSREDIERLARLARLELADEEQGRYAGQLSSVVSYVDQLGQVDTSSVGQSRGVSGLRNVLADDAERAAGDLAGVPRESLLDGVPSRSDNLIQVRAVL